MKRFLDDPHALENLLQPETPLERLLLSTAEFRHGLLWGEPRFGHPEGKVALHVREVLDNIDLIQHLLSGQREQLRLIAFTHDTFKYAEDRSRPRDWQKHHGLLARRYLESYTNDTMVLDVIETHDDAYYIWLAERHGSGPEGKTLDALLHRMDYCLKLYYLFFKCDTQTGDKTQAPLKWFERMVEGIEWVAVREGIV
ncbi:MAG TPA: hypothetical protein PK228_18155 [Saprospiraceae bacterium]|nr:hypothetical protein [Saprospiraceae bacterium]